MYKMTAGDLNPSHLDGQSSALTTELPQVDSFCFVVLGGTKYGGPCIQFNISTYPRGARSLLVCLDQSWVVSLDLWGD